MDQPVSGGAASAKTLDCGLNAAGKNRLLELLPELDRARLMRQMVRVSAQRRDGVFKRRTPIGDVHFPLSAVISVVTVMEDGAMAEVGTIGNEGFAGLPLIFGNKEDANDAFYQIPGETLLMPSVIRSGDLARRAASERRSSLCTSVLRSNCSEHRLQPAPPSRAATCPLDSDVARSRRSENGVADAKVSGADARRSPADRQHRGGNLAKGGADPVLPRCH